MCSDVDTFHGIKFEAIDLPFRVGVCTYSAIDINEILNKTMKLRFPRAP